jgi:hypothetical protein
MALFTLEALEAKHGDSLILHYGDPKDPRFFLIDGGPAGVYKGTLRPRLVEIKERWAADGPLPLQMVMVSHIDDDHINGILSLTNELLRGGEPLCEVLAFWHNSFDDLLGNIDEDLFSVLPASVKAAAVGGGPARAAAGARRHVAAVAASVGQGRKLRANAEKLGLTVNAPFEGLILTETAGDTEIDFGDGLTLVVLGPNRERVEDLHEKWERELEKKGAAEAAAAAFTDDSVFNLSSIVVLAELGGKRMLLTGDARGDDTLKAVAEAKLFKKGKLHVDLLKVPHHGSDRNVDTDFFRKITADHYVLSGNGDFGNPEVATLRMISDARGTDTFTLHLTNRDGKDDLGPKLEEFFAGEKKKKKKYKVNFRDDAKPSLKVDLLEKVKY